MERYGAPPFAFCLVGMSGDVAKNKVGLEGEAAVDAVEKKSEEPTERAIAGEAALDGEEENEPVENIGEYTDEELRREYRGICKALLKKAKEGNVAAAKLLVYFREQFGNGKTAKQRVGKSLSELLLDELKRRQDEREAAIDAAKAEEQNSKTNEADGEGVKSGGDAERG